jgi:hypothetical protein
MEKNKLLGDEAKEEEETSGNKYMRTEQRKEDKDENEVQKRRICLCFFLCLQCCIPLGDLVVILSQINSNFFSAIIILWVI